MSEDRIRPRERVGAAVARPGGPILFCAPLGPVGRLMVRRLRKQGRRVEFVARPSDAAPQPRRIHPLPQSPCSGFVLELPAPSGVAGPADGGRGAGWGAAIRAATIEPFEVLRAAGAACRRGGGGTIVLVVPAPPATGDRVAAVVARAAAVTLLRGVARGLPDTVQITGVVLPDDQGSRLTQVRHEAASLACWLLENAPGLNGRILWMGPARWESPMDRIVRWDLG